MPLEVQDVEWSETARCVLLRVPLRGAQLKNVDIFTANTYVKVSFPPYLFELALYDSIDCDVSKATVANGQVVFQLVKVNERLWRQLHADSSKDKTFMREVRETALKWHQDREIAKTRKRSEERDRMKKFSVKQQIKLDSDERHRVDALKDMQTKCLSAEVEEWKRNGDNSPAKKNDTPPKQLISCPQKEDHFQKPVHQLANDSLQETKKELPRPRSGGNICVSFTPRQLSTPARESKLPEEKLWLEKVAQMNKIRETKNADVANIEEMNPMWLKDKGKLYANRAACHLILKQFSECVQDCTCALNLYDPPVEANIQARCRVYSRRGAAYMELEEYIQALRDYEAAIKLNPRNEALKTDAYKIRKIIQGEESTE